MISWAMPSVRGARSAGGGSEGTHSVAVLEVSGRTVAWWFNRRSAGAGRASGARVVRRRWVPGIGRF